MSINSKKARKIFYIVLTSFFSALIIAAAVFSVLTYIEYKKILAYQQQVVAANKEYEAANFDDPNLNYIKAPEKDKVKPGEELSFEVLYKNTGLVDADDLKILVAIPENLEVVETSLKDYSYKVENDSIIFSIGSLKVGSGGSIKIAFKVSSPLDKGTLISVPDLKFNFYKEALLIGKKGNFENDFSSDVQLVVESSPDFANSKIIIEGKEGNEQNLVTYGDSIAYRLVIKNDGDMVAKDIKITIKNLDSLIIDAEENPEFEVSGGTVSLMLDEIKSGQQKTYNLTVKIDDKAENNLKIIPLMEINYKDSEQEIKAPESIVKLYPSFEKSSIGISARGSGGVYSGDVLDVIVNIKNSGNIEASNVIINLVLSNLLILDQGQTSWKIEKLEVGKGASFQTSVRVADGITKDTHASSYIDILSDEIEAIQTGKASILISGERPFTRNVIPIVALHGIEPNAIGLYELSTAQFDFLCGTLKAMGYKTITFMDLLGYLDSGKRLPEKPVIITSDDGYYSTYAYAFPILQKYGYKMTVFLTTGLIGSSNDDRRLNEFDIGKPGIQERPMLIWPEVAAMAKYGIEFQSHTVSHRKTGDLSADEVLFELSQSKADIEGHLRKPCIFIAWPFDNYSNSFIPLLPQVGYRGAIRYKGGIEDVSGINIYAIKRIPFYSSTPTSSYAELLGLY
ncbi:MAG: hypothetical protein FJW56_02545 [Actinobacteria bacterium]|nr:hypothetical protein [Actinomycetota bacterium]